MHATVSATGSRAWKLNAAAFTGKTGSTFPHESLALSNRDERPSDRRDGLGNIMVEKNYIVPS
jgi:hypothetical protein